MRILLHGGAPWSPSGYAVQTRLFAPRLQALGHDIAIACWHGFNGGNRVGEGTLSLPGPRGPITLYPESATGAYSFDVLPGYYQHFEADLCITILDAWVCQPQVFQHGERWIPLFPVDCEPLAPGVKRAAEKGIDRFVISRFGEQMCKDAGVDATYIPAVYDPAYQPEGENLRAILGWDDKYVVGVVAANKGWPARKNWPQIFEGFALFREQVPEARLYIHSKMDSTPPYDGMNLYRIAHDVGLVKGDMIHSEQVGAGLGYSPEEMASVYRTFDVLLNPAMGEGFGVPIVEAQACGIPVVAGDWTAMTEVTRTGVLIPKEKALRFGFYQESVTNQWIPHPEDVATALHTAYQRSGTGDWPSRGETSSRVAEYAADRVVADHFAPALERLEARKPVVGPNRAQRRRAKIKGKAVA